MEIESLLNHLRKDEKGIYCAGSQKDISYPEEGNELCFQIEDNSFWFAHRNRVIENIVKAWDANIFFDIGGGNGFVASGLQKSGVQVALVEPGRKGCVNARKRNLSYVVQATLEAAEFKNHSLPAVGLFDVLEHIENDQEFLLKLGSLLKKGGLLFLTVPAYNWLWSNEDRAAGHYRRYNLRQLNKLFLQCGYTVEYSSYFFALLPLPIFLFRSVPSWFQYSDKVQEQSHYQSEHQDRKGVFGNLLNKIFEWELGSIKKKKKILVGSSCLLVAKKI